MTQYEEQILKEVRALPQEALPKVLRLLILVREEFLAQGQPKPPNGSLRQSSHEQTRQLLAASTGNWAQDLVAEREDRL
jgi:hypothetical protein